MNVEANAHRRRRLHSSKRSLRRARAINDEAQAHRERDSMLADDRFQFSFEAGRSYNLYERTNLCLTMGEWGVEGMRALRRGWETREACAM